MHFLSFLLRALLSNLRTVSVSAREQRKLEARGIADPTLQRYLVWRRSTFALVLLPTLLSAGIATTNQFYDAPGPARFIWNAFGVTATTTNSPPSSYTAFGVFADSVQLFSLFAVPLSALIAVFFWSRWKLSRRIILAGWLIAFLVPMLLALCPWGWWGYEDLSERYGADDIRKYKRVVDGFREGASYLVTLMPTVLSLIPGVQYACLRIKTLQPESMLPGWFLVSASPFYSLLMLVVFVAINQVASDPLFLIGMFLWLGAPLLFVVWANYFTRPLTNDADFQRMWRVQLLVQTLIMVAMGLLTWYLFTKEIFGFRLLGLGDKSLLHPADLVQYALEYLGRMLFVTVLAADLFLQMNLSIWHNTRALVGSPGAESYDRTMEELERISR